MKLEKPVSVLLADFFTHKRWTVCPRGKED